jgi:hypothetical protein
MEFTAVAQVRSVTLPQPQKWLFIFEFYGFYTKLCSLLLISKEFMGPQHQDFRNWYFTKIDKSKQDFIKDHVYKDLENRQTVIPFKTWFLDWYQNQYHTAVIQDR